MSRAVSVSYTHLDVYKRQDYRLFRLSATGRPEITAEIRESSANQF